LSTGSRRGLRRRGPCAPVHPAGWRGAAQRRAVLGLCGRGSRLAGPRDGL